MGSPPRVRGKVECFADEQHLTGITPARAGKSPASCHWPTVQRDHPRACGEKILSMPCWYVLSGSPPRVRGKGGQDPLFPHHPGITPARAGKSPVSRAFLLFYRDHPRACGEKFRRWTRPALSMGSPPRVRGKDIMARGNFNGAGITPARAGKSGTGSRCSGTHGDHPRACGEKMAACWVHTALLGSPPRVRGKEIEANRDAIAHRITPARAGKSRSTSYPQQRPRDHPRACGEKTLYDSAHLGPKGSPPRVRGKVIGSGLGPIPFRITPARAGKSQWS